MNVFGRITTANPFDAIEGAVQAIEERRRGRGLLGKPWSVAELAMDPEDYQWLCAWAASLPEQTARIWLRYRERYERIGLLLTVFASEVARREAAEKSLWAIVSRAGWQPETRRVLFYNDYPRQVHRDALEAAARLYDLRHVFDQEGVDKWLASLFLQFGFTRRGAERRLAEWLVALGQPDAVERLLDGKHPSDSFSELWELLRLFRRGDIAEAELRHGLRESPWVLPEWADWLVPEARSRIASLGTGASCTSVRSDRGELETTIFGDFLGTPRLHWVPPETPKFMCEVGDLAALGLTGDAYSIAVGGKHSARVVRQADGAYRSLSTSQLEIKPDGPEVIATLIGADTGTTVESQHVRLWEQGGDVSVFTFPAGKQIDAWTDVLNRTAAYVLVIAPDLEICPPPAERRRFQNVQFCLLPANWAVETRVTLESETLWRPNLTGQDASSLPMWLKDVTVDDVGEVEIGKPCELQIRHPADVIVRFARSSLGTLALRTHGERLTHAVPLSTNPASLCGTLDVVLGVRRSTGDLHRVRRQVRWEIVGEARLGENGWQALSKTMVLSQDDAISQRFHIRPPRRIHGTTVDLHEWRIMEGTTPTGELSGRPAPLRRLSGWGAPLTLRRGPYNQPASEDDRPLVCAVVDPGIVLSCECDHTVTGVSLKLKCPIEPSDRHSVVLVDHDARCLVIPSSRVICEEADPREWLVDLGEWPWWSMRKPVAAGITYDGYRLGAWWDPAWYRWLLAKSKVANDDAEQAMELAALIRWFRLPVLMRDAMSAVREFVGNSPVPVLTSWLLRDDATVLSPTGEIVLRFADADEGWFVVLRKFFRDRQPTCEEAAFLAETMRTDTDIWPVESLVFRLGRIDPLLMGRVLTRWLESNGTADDRRVLIKFLRDQLAKTASTRTKHIAPNLRTNSRAPYFDDSVMIRQTSLADAVEQATGWDPRFIEDGLIETARRLFRGERIESWEEANLDVALNVKAFRDLLAYAILGEVSRKALSHVSA